MEEIINALLDVVREQQRNGVPPEAAMSRSDVVNMALKMMQQQGTEIEQETVTETWRTVLRMAPKLFGTDTSDVPPAALSPSEQIIRKMEPDKNITAGNENVALDKMIFSNFQSMLGGNGGEIKTDPEPEKPAAPARPKSAAELAADAIRLADENKRKGIKPQAPPPGQRRPVTNKKGYKGIPKASNTIKGEDGQGKSASQLAYEAQRQAEERAREQARIREEMEARMAQEAMKRGEPDPRIAAAKEREEREAAIREMELKRAARDGVEPPPESESAAKKEETPEEKRARIEREHEERKAREWAEAEAEAKAAKERARAERDAKAMAEAEKARIEKERQRMSPEERKAAEERAARRAKAREEAQAAKEEKNAKTRLEAAKLIQERAQSKTEKAAQTTKKAVETIQKGMAAALGTDSANKLEMNEETLNKLVLEKYQEMIRHGAKASDIDMTKLTSMVIEALSKEPEEDEEPLVQDLDELIEEAWEGDAKKETPVKQTAVKEEKEEVPERVPEQIPEQVPQKTKTPVNTQSRTEKKQRPAREKKQSTDFSFASFRNAKSFMGELEDYLNSSGPGRKVHTGIEPVDHLLSEGLEPGIYVVQADESIGADSFQLQTADYIASRGKDVLYLLSDSSRYGMMVKSISRLTYELRGKDKGMARSSASILNCQSKADMANLRKEFSYYEQKMGEHLYLLEQKTMDSDNILDLIEGIVDAFRKEKESKPVVFLDDIYWMVQNEEDLLVNLADLADSIEVPVVLSVGSGEFEDEDLCSTKIEIHYTGVRDDKEKMLQKEIQAENGQTLLADLKITKKDTGKQMSGRVAVTPKFHYFTKVTGEDQIC